MSTQDFLAKSAFDDLANSIEQALSNTEDFRDEAEDFADLARRGIRLVGVVADLNSFPANPEDGDAVLVESETQIYFWDATSSEWKNSQIVGSAIWGNVQGTLSDQSDLQTALDGKGDYSFGEWTPFLTFGGDDSGFVYSRNLGYYSKINNLVVLTGSVAWSDIGTGTGVANLEGLPFQAINSDRARSNLNVGRIRSISLTGAMGGINSINNKIINLIDNANGEFVFLDNTDFSTGGSFDFSFQHFTNE